MTDATRHDLHCVSTMTNMTGSTELTIRFQNAVKGIGQ